MHDDEIDTTLENEPDLAPDVLPEDDALDPGDEDGKPTQEDNEEE